MRFVGLSKDFAPEEQEAATGHEGSCMPAAPVAAYLSAWAGLPGSRQGSWDAMRPRMTAEEVSTPAAAYLGAWAGRPGSRQWSWEAMRPRMTAEEVSMPAAPNAAMGSVAASAMRTSTERRGPRSSAHSKKSSPPAQGSTASDRMLQQLYIINTLQACSLPLKAVSHPKAVQRARHMPGGQCVYAALRKGLSTLGVADKSGFTHVAV